jgi:hypothetical protein
VSATETNKYKLTEDITDIKQYDFSEEINLEKARLSILNIKRFVFGVGPNK